MLNCLFFEHGRDEVRHPRFHEAAPHVVQRPGHFYISFESVHVAPIVLSRQGLTLVIFGSPVLNGVPLGEDDDLDIVVNKLRSSPTAFDSVFLIFLYSEQNRSCEVWTDRFGWFPLMYFESSGVLCFSTSTIDIIEFKRAFGNVEVDTNSIFEFLWFRRLFLSSCVVSGVETIPPASKIFLKNAKKQVAELYWSPNAETNGSHRYKDRDYVDLIATGIREGVESGLRAANKPGLMLSGGLDSRALLAVGRERYISVTNTIAKNNEFKIAERVASIVGSKHYHLKRPERYLSNVFDESVRAANASNLYYECQFLGYVQELGAVIDEVHLGLFLDIFFCGHYMPKKHPRIGSRHALHFVDEQIPDDDPVSFFMEHISYRQKTSIIREVVHSDKYQGLYRNLRKRIGDVFSQGQERGFRGVELWEYCHLVNLGRHYSGLMARSLTPHMSVRIPALTNLNYSTAFLIPPEKKRNWGVYLAALRKLDGEIMKVPNSNTNIRADRSLYEQTAIKLYRGLANKLGVGKYVTSPTYEDRSWPPVRQSIVGNPEIEARLRSTISHGRVFEIGILDRERVQQMLDQTLCGRHDHSIFLNQLLTLEYGLFKII